MRLRRVKNQTPQSSPPSSVADGGTAGDERLVWEMLVPRLIHPGKLAIIQTLLGNGEPVSLAGLAEAADITLEHARYHCKAILTAGVLEVASLAPRTDGEGEEPSYFFPKRPQGPPSSPTAA
jgi:hypothetical protein